MRRDPTRPELSDAERILLGYLHRHCRGVARARTYARLRDDLAMQAGLVIGEREMYEVVSSLVCKGRPVGTTSAHGGGAFIVQDARDARAAYRNLYGRVCRQLRRCRAFKRTARETVTRQRYLDLAEAEAAYAAALSATREAARAFLAEKMTEGLAEGETQGQLFRNPMPGSRT